MTHDLLSQLKAKCEFDALDAAKEYIEVCKRRENRGLVRIDDMIRWQHTKDRAIMDALIECLELALSGLNLVAETKGLRLAKIEHFPREELINTIEYDTAIARSTQAAVSAKLKEILK